MADPTRFPNGVTNAARLSTLWDMPALDPTKMFIFFRDFVAINEYSAGSNAYDAWTQTTTQAGSGNASVAVQDANAGILLITNDDADDDAVFIQARKEVFKFISGKQTWFKTKFKVSDATQSDVVIGLQITDTSPLAVTDGVFFLKSDGAATVDFLVEKNSTATTASAITSLVSDTYITLGFHYDGISAIKYFVNDVHYGTSVTTNLVDDEELTISFGIQNGEAVAKTMSVDYILAASER